MSHFIMLVGLPGSGKSYYAKEFLIDNPEYKYYSSDAYRKNNNLKYTDKSFFDKLHNEMRKELLSGHNVLYDATNISAKHRTVILRMLRNETKTTCLVMATNLDICLANNRNFNRDHIVPDAWILKYYHSFSFPQYYEGWDEIKIIKPAKLGMHNTYNLEDVLNNLDTYDQNTIWHKYTLGEHMRKTGDKLKSLYCDAELILAGYLHDIGKPFIKTIDELTGESHFYGHANVSAYESMFCEGIFDHVRVAQLISLHMRAHDDEWMEKNTHLDIYDDLCKLRDADIYASGISENDDNWSSTRHI